MAKIGKSNDWSAWDEGSKLFLCGDPHHGVALLAALVLTGCSYGRYTGDVEENPVVDTGVGAAVIMAFTAD